MKKPSDHDAKMINLISRLQEQISSLDKKVDILMGRMMATPALMSNIQKSPQLKEKVQFKIICADCGKESTLHFKPNNDRPVYCKECYALRKRGAASGHAGPIKAEQGYPNIAPALSPLKTPVKASPAKAKKKTIARKTAPKRKPVTKKKK